MAVRKLKLTHPGKILREQFMTPIGLSAYALAKALGVSPSRVSHIARARRGISPETAVLLSVYFRTSESYWINLQAHFDLEVAKDRLRKHVARVVPHSRGKTRLPQRTAWVAAPNSRGKAKRVRKPRATRSRLETRKGNPPDSEIDTTDIPPLGDKFFGGAVRNPFYRRTK